LRISFFQRGELKVSLCKGRFRGIFNSAHHDFDENLELSLAEKLDVIKWNLFDPADSRRFALTGFHPKRSIKFRDALSPKAIAVFFGVEKISANSESFGRATLKRER
jgi:hypothetical protein